MLIVQLQLLYFLRLTWVSWAERREWILSSHFLPSSPLFFLPPLCHHLEGFVFLARRLSLKVLSSSWQTLSRRSHQSFHNLKLSVQVVSANEHGIMSAAVVHVYLRGSGSSGAEGGRDAFVSCIKCCSLNDVQWWWNSTVKYVLKFVFLDCLNMFWFLYIFLPTLYILLLKLPFALTTANLSKLYFFASVFLCLQVNRSYTQVRSRLFRKSSLQVQRGSSGPESLLLPLNTIRKRAR